MPDWNGSTTLSSDCCLKEWGEGSAGGELWLQRSVGAKLRKQICFCVLSDRTCQTVSEKLWILNENGSQACFSVWSSWLHVSTPHAASPIPGLHLSTICHQRSYNTTMQHIFTLFIWCTGRHSCCLHLSLVNMLWVEDSGHISLPQDKSTKAIDWLMNMKFKNDVKMRCTKCGIVFLMYWGVTMMRHWLPQNL